jgi:hypothetical protein
MLVNERGQAQLLTNKGVRSIDEQRIPCETGSTRSHRLLRLETGEEVLQIVR